MSEAERSSMMKWGADGHAVRQIFWAWATRQEGKLIMYSVGDRKPVVQLVTKLVFGAQSTTKDYIGADNKLQSEN